MAAAKPVSGIGFITTNLFDKEAGMAGKWKGVCMIREIQRLRAMGLGKRAEERTLQISRNTLRKYWDLEEKGKAAVSPPAFQSPWSEDVDWDSARKGAERGQSLAHYQEEFQGAVDAGGSICSCALCELLEGIPEAKSGRRAPVRTIFQTGFLFRDRLQGKPSGVRIYRPQNGGLHGLRAVCRHAQVQPVSVGGCDFKPAEGRLLRIDRQGLQGLWRGSTISARL